VVYALRYTDLISEIQEASAYAWPRDEGDIVNALLIGLPDSIGLSLGVTVSQKGLSCRVPMGSAMFSRMRPQSNQELARMKAADLYVEGILAIGEIPRTDEVFLAAMGITDGPLFRGSGTLGPVPSPIRSWREGRQAPGG
jgi:fructose-1,6-bisphosphatase II